MTFEERHGRPRCGGCSPEEEDVELREDGTEELREDGTTEIRE